MDIQTIVAAAIFAGAIILLISMMKNKLLHGGSCCGFGYLKELSYTIMSFDKK